MPLPMCMSMGMVEQWYIQMPAWWREPVDEALAGVDGPHGLVGCEGTGVEVDAVVDAAIVDQVISNVSPTRPRRTGPGRCR
jgi:hypothetical protein